MINPLAEPYQREPVLTIYRAARQAYQRNGNTKLK
jgi:hypothetical protein